MRHFIEFGVNSVRAVLVLSGGVFFLWFFLPALIKGLWNFGSVCGILFSVLAGYYGIRFYQVNGWIGRFLQFKAGRIAVTVFAVLCVAGIILSVLAAAAILQAQSHDIPKNTPAVVLGCSVKGERPSRVLSERIDAAYLYMLQNPEAVCILSGGKGPGEDISEAECMYRELTAMGVDANRLYREEDSVNTEGNLRNSSEMLKELGADMSGQLTIISSEFHLYRGRRWAKRLGYSTYGYGARTDWRYFPTFFLREIIAVISIWLLP